ncbi:MAG: hypothetical protein A3F26_02520 [Candidatus Ryanbacteria bacterium RIFCSPHIGHO2_12_FULL_47_12b]|uniref:Uncharacterized protein n=1 Tax=Candidatus Ryanbacteria bacterium RIFCSPLOWO2_02_FULL_47_14 TaxID=1802129 RepID=A0A1G2GZK1_9BACT|nr:MAG: hypothetical protein UX74_C0015G0038 [Parcubacteria group bacterium GW2011_GWA2_47_10b]KKU86393.1 MAG: hypothetical protein UY14_C0002G0035 [Parcubacteria group bacterium GW2011_GWA1_47_9]OGZ44382.1 MAG: hypothetical protein A2844_01585 [Candidatus Ryanbacteria bacterium RIFCSPHIGHO2_01_FULL_48_80]OGZ48023.1 MAG: hypothetical protein A3C83_01415 [Candidatus Ryanbacteria bacterium RIFCSPHIGHO2_02_FULL_47_25]OGZ52406.1 MAG: hypothetical protein A3F26_02520 [Candidatus Ryanbacteria bacteri
MNEQFPNNLGNPEKPKYRKTERFEPDDPFGSLNHLLEDYDWEESRYILSEDQRERLERAIAANKPEESPVFEKVLENYEGNVLRPNIIHQIFALFDDIEQLLPDDAQYFREKLRGIDDRIKGRFQSMATDGEQTKDAGVHVPVPYDVVKDLRTLLLEYRDELAVHDEIKKRGITQE